MSIPENFERYGFARWGGRHFAIDRRGRLCVEPLADGRQIPILDVIEETRSKGLDAPLVIRFQDLLRYRVVQLNEAFRAAIAEEKYAGAYKGVFPIKVNQLREVVEEILDAGRPYDFGLEAGSRPELAIALALHGGKGLLVCNGYKDEQYIRLALIGRKLGKEVVLVVEQLSELSKILKIAREMEVEPLLGFRVKLATTGEGKWAESSGAGAKFGLTAAEIVEGARRLKRAGFGDSLVLLHFHIGSQVPNIRALSAAATEAARTYAELHKMGFPMRYLDVGGGLGIDYDGSRTHYESSMNYSLEEYARDIVYSVGSVCTEAGVPAPDLVSESGRALVAPHSILVVEVFDRIAKPLLQPDESGGDKARVGKKGAGKARHKVVRALEEIRANPRDYGLLERYHDAQAKKAEAESLFLHGFLDLESRARAEALFWQICADVRGELSTRAYKPDELLELDHLLADQYVCNFSVFQSLLDHWACQQLFPVAPLHRLDETPTVPATLVDITCDSEGKIDQFIDLEEDFRKTLPLHPLKPGKPYYLGIFLVGAYQDIMGDLHNLFGRVNEVHVFLEEDEEDGFYIEESIRGLSMGEVLPFVQHNAADLERLLKKQVDKAIRADTVRPREGTEMLETYAELLARTTYLEPRPPKPPRKRSVKKAAKK